MTVYLEVFDDDDNGVTDWWFVTIAGSPISPVPGNLGAWRIRPEGHPLTAFIAGGDLPARKRDYHLSREAT
jgi:hypothetical protein